MRLVQWLKQKSKDLVSLFILINVLNVTGILFSFREQFFSIEKKVIVKKREYMS